MSIPSIYVVGGAVGYANWIIGSCVPCMEQADLVMFTGGTDVGARHYGKKAHPANEAEDTKRDTQEKVEFDLALRWKIPMLGICRGAQFLCVMNGGILVQHQAHPPKHYVHTIDGRQVWSTSDHHQRAYPFGIDKHKVIGWAKHGTSPFNHGESDKDDMTGQPEVEICYYPNSKALGIQSHPEWMFPVSNQEEHDALMFHRMLIAMLMKGSL